VSRYEFLKFYGWHRIEDVV